MGGKDQFPLVPRYRPGGRYQRIGTARSSLTNLPCCSCVVILCAPVMIAITISYFIVPGGSDFNTPVATRILSVTKGPDLA